MALDPQLTDQDGTESVPSLIKRDAASPDFIGAGFRPETYPLWNAFTVYNFEWGRSGGPQAANCRPMWGINAPKGSIFRLVFARPNSHFHRVIQDLSAPRSAKLS